MFLIIFIYLMSHVFQIGKCFDDLNDDSELTPYIVGGTETTIEDHPFRALILYSRTRCSGSILSQNVLLTASHCVFMVDPKSIRIYVGKSSIEKMDEGYTVLDMKAHPLYHGKGFDHDVAIIAVNGRFKFGNTVQPIQLAPSNYQLEIGSHVSVAGWGRLEADGSMLPDILREVNVPVIPWSKCRDLYVHPAKMSPRSRPMEPKPVDRKTFCAGDLENGGIDACQGDSGGGVTQDTYLVGVVSWGLSCANRNYPGVYASVMGYRKWIVANVVYYDELLPVQYPSSDISGWTQRKSLKSP